MSQEIQKVKKSRLFWIGLLSSILIYINGNPLIPLGILIVLVLILLRKNFQEQFKANLKKFLIAMLIGFFLGVSGMGLQVKFNYGEEKTGISFNFNLLPSNLIGLFYEGKDYTNTIFDNNQFSGDTEECKKLSKNFIEAYNNKDSDSIIKMIYSKSNSGELNKVKREFEAYRGLLGIITGLDYKGYIRYKNIENNESFLQQFLYFKSTVEFQTSGRDLQFKCIYNYDNKKWEVLGFDIPSENRNYKVTKDEIPFGNMMEK